MQGVRLIDANALLKSEIERCHCVPLVCTTDLNGIACDCNSLKNVLDRQPTIEPKVRHGRWVHHSGGYSDHFECTACGEDIVLTGKWRFCPNCGADMTDMREEGANNE